MVNDSDGQQKYHRYHTSYTLLVVLLCILKYALHFTRNFCSQGRYLHALPGVFTNFALSTNSKLLTSTKADATRSYHFELAQTFHSFNTTVLSHLRVPGKRYKSFLRSE